jgi:DNA-binding response OmpR family regulator
LKRVVHKDLLSERLGIVASGNHATVFLLESDEAVRGTCARVLSRGGYHVETLDGSADLDVLMQAGPDAVVVDLRRPCHESLELIRGIRACDRRVVIIVTAANPTVSNAVDALKAGADEILPEPFSPDELKLAVAVAMEQRKGRAC